MKKLFVFCLLFVAVTASAQMNPLVILDGKKLGYMNDVKKEMQDIVPNDVASMTVLKDIEAAKSYGSDSGVIIIVRKKYLLDSFYAENIQNSALKERIKSAEDLTKIGIVNADKGKNVYDELSKYVFTNTVNKKILKVTGILFFDAKEAVRLNPAWTSGAIEISSE